MALAIALSAPAASDLAHPPKRASQLPIHPLLRPIATPNAMPALPHPQTLNPGHLGARTSMVRAHRLVVAAGERQEIMVSMALRVGVSIQVVGGRTLVNRQRLSNLMRPQAAYTRRRAAALRRLSSRLLESLSPACLSIWTKVLSTKARCAFAAHSVHIPESGRKGTAASKAFAMMYS